MHTLVQYTLANPSLVNPNPRLSEQDIQANIDFIK